MWGKLVLFTIIIASLTLPILTNESKQKHVEVLETKPAYKEEVGVVSAYTYLAALTDSTPCITSSGYNICSDPVGVVANNCYPFGTIVDIEGVQYMVEDRMNRRYDCSHWDIVKDSYDEAIQFGRKKLTIKILYVPTND